MGKTFTMIGVWMVLMVLADSARAVDLRQHWDCAPHAITDDGIDGSNLRSVSQHLVVRYRHREKPDDVPVFGSILPMDQVILDDKGPAITFETNTEIKIGHLRVPPGRYSLFFLPLQDGMTVIVNKRSDGPGNEYDLASDLGRIAMIPTEPLDCSVLTIRFGKIVGQRCGPRESGDDQPCVPADLRGKTILRFEWGEANYIVPIEQINSTSETDERRGRE